MKTHAVKASRKRVSQNVCRNAAYLTYKTVQGDLYVVLLRNFDHKNIFLEQFYIRHTINNKSHCKYRLILFKYLLSNNYINFSRKLLFSLFISIKSRASSQYFEFQYFLFLSIPPIYQYCLIC